MNEYVKIQVLNSAVEAGLLESLLKERGIPHMIVSYYDSALDGLFQAQKGWGIVKAPKEYEGEIKAIYREISRGGWEPSPADAE